MNKQILAYRCEFGFVLKTGCDKDPASSPTAVVLVVPAPPPGPSTRLRKPGVVGVVEPNRLACLRRAGSSWGGASTAAAVLAIEAARRPSARFGASAAREAPHTPYSSIYNYKTKHFPPQRERDKAQLFLYAHLSQPTI